MLGLGVVSGSACGSELEWLGFFWFCVQVDVWFWAHLCFGVWGGVDRRGGADRPSCAFGGKFIVSAFFNFWLSLVDVLAV